MAHYIPLFPLPNVTLFPRTHVALHVFEPRYLSMMEQVLKEDRRLAICTLRPGWEKDYEGSPPVNRVAGAARVLVADRTKAGTWDIIVEGIERVYIHHEVQTEPFRIGLVEAMVDRIPENEVPQAREVMHSVARLAEALALQVPQLRRRLSNLVNTHQHPGVVCDIVAAELVEDPYARQSILAEGDVVRRLRLLSIQLDLLVASLRERGLEVPPQGNE